MIIHEEETFSDVVSLLIRANTFLARCSISNLYLYTKSHLSIFQWISANIEKLVISPFDVDIFPTQHLSVPHVLMVNCFWLETKKLFLLCNFHFLAMQWIKWKLPEQYFMSKVSLGIIKCSLR